MKASVYRLISLSEDDRFSQVFPQDIGRVWPVVFASLLSFLFMPFLSQAEFIPPGEVEIKTEKYQPVFDSLVPGEYYYSVEWEGIPVAKAVIEVQESFISESEPQKALSDNVEATAKPESTDSKKSEELVKVAATTKTTGIVKAFYKMRHRSESTFRKSDFQPISYNSEQKENSKLKFRQVSFNLDGSVESERWKKGRGKNLMRFASDNPVFDPISAAFLAKSLRVEEGQKLGFDVYNGKHRFLINFYVKGVEVIDTEGGKRRARKIVPEVFRLTDTEGEKKLRSALIWISDDEKRELLKIESEVWIGAVTAELESFKRKVLPVKSADETTLSPEKAKVEVASPSDGS